MLVGGVTSTLDIYSCSVHTPVCKVSLTKRQGELTHGTDTQVPMGSQ